MFGWPESPWSLYCCRVPDCMEPQAWFLALKRSDFLGGEKLTSSFDWGTEIVFKCSDVPSNVHKWIDTFEMCSVVPVLTLLDNWPYFHSPMGSYPLWGISYCVPKLIVQAADWAIRMLSGYHSKDFLWHFLATGSRFWICHWYPRYL